MRKTLLALILAACAALTFPTAATASPAHTGPSVAHAGPSVVHPMGPNGYGFCFPTPGGGWFCVIVVYVPQPCHCPPPPCGDCPEAVDLGLAVLPPNEATQVYGNVQTGMQQLGQATVTTDPRQAAALRAAALNSFTNAAKLLGGLQLSQPTVGFLDAKGAFNPDPVSWRQQAGNDLAKGLIDLQQSFVQPVPQPWRDAAAASFNEANTIYAQHAGSSVQG
ncbi:MAG TPA: hypothetical protein VH352_09000 [Pseudonocardiaceae bacterium]|jgi:hypothetical protein|nr:hypothetical protein [Pseudonocardiaceae bacterium]